MLLGNSVDLGGLLHVAQASSLNRASHMQRPDSCSSTPPGSNYLNSVIHTHGRGLLFASDFRKHVEAAELLMAALPGEAEAELAALDLLLRWAVVRLCDPHGNTTCLLRMLELCQALLGLLVDAGGQLSQYDALCLLPCLVEKAGHNQARVVCFDHVFQREDFEKIMAL